MPLARGSSQSVLSSNVAALIRAGHEPKQAVAIAYRVAGEAKDDMDQAGFDALIERATADCLATDESMRVADEFGRWTVKTSHISKATVNPYYGREIPGCEALGLDPNRVYRLLRDPEELRRAAGTFDGVQLLLEHVPVSAEDPQQEIVVGCVTDPEFNSPYLDAKLHIWTQEAIDLIEDEKRRELSCCYAYDPDMTAGVFEGEPYDGVMRNLRGNHTTIVENGRAGPDVLVADSDIDPKAAGVMAVAPSGEMLFLKRSAAADHPGTWCFPGGMIEDGETPEEAARREMGEETGHKIDGDVKPVDHRQGFVTHHYEAPLRFKPRLNDEHTDFRWAAPDKAPEPMHPGVAATLAHVSPKSANPGPAQDQSLEESHMASKTRAARKAALSRTAARVQGAILAGLNLAADASIDLKPVLAGVTAKNFEAKKTAIWTEAKKLAEGKFASDDGATPDDVMMRVLDMVQKEAGPEEAEADEVVDEDPATDPNAAPPAAAGGEQDENKDDKILKLLAHLEASGMGEDELAAAKKACGMDDGDPMAGGKVPATDEEDDEKMNVSKAAMDAALQAATRTTEERVVTRFREASEAREFVRPWVGEVAVAFDSAPAIYRAALKTIGVAEADTLPDASLQPILRNLPKPGARTTTTEHHLAADASAVDELTTLIPHLARIGVQA